VIHKPEKPGDFKKIAKKWLRLLNKFCNQQTVILIRKNTKEVNT